MYIIFVFIFVSDIYIAKYNYLIIINIIININIKIIININIKIIINIKFANIYYL